MRILVAAALAATVAAAPAFADETTGHVLAYDRQAGILVLTDLTVWELPADFLVPADLGRGDRVHLVYASAGEDDLTAITEMHRTATALPPGTDGGS